MLIKQDPTRRCAGKLLSCNIQRSGLKARPELLVSASPPPPPPLNQCCLHPFNEIISSAVSLAIVLSPCCCVLRSGLPAPGLFGARGAASRKSRALPFIIPGAGGIMGALGSRRKTAEARWTPDTNTAASGSRARLLYFWSAGSWVSSLFPCLYAHTNSWEECVQ